MKREYTDYICDVCGSVLSYHNPKPQTVIEVDVGIRVDIIIQDPRISPDFKICNICTITVLRRAIELVDQKDDDRCYPNK